MKKRWVVAVPLALLLGLGVCGAASADELSDAAARGALLFRDPGLGTNGRTCSNCHADGSVWAGKARFPKVAVGGLHTIDQAIQICVSGALAGKLLAWDDPRLTALAVFVDAAYATKK